MDSGPQAKSCDFNLWTSLLSYKYLLMTPRKMNRNMALYLSLPANQRQLYEETCLLNNYPILYQYHFLFPEQGRGRQPPGSPKL